MPVTAGSQSYAAYSPVHTDTGTNRSGRSNSTAVNYESEYDRDNWRTCHERVGSGHEVERVQSPKRSPSLLRRINAAMKSKSSPSMSSVRQVSPARGASASAARADPMYAAPSTPGPSRSSSSTMNPVSRFRRARNADKSMNKHGPEAERGQPYQQREWRVDERTKQNDSALSRSRSDARVSHNSSDGWVVYRRPGESSKHARTESEGTRDEGRTRRSPLSCKQASEPVPHSSAVARPPARNPSHSSPQHTSSERRLPERSEHRVDSREPRPASPATNPPRMGRHGIYASPTPSSTQISRSTRDNVLTNGSLQSTNMHKYASPSGRVEGWEVQIAPPAASSQSKGGPGSRHGFFRRRPTQTRTSSSNSASLTLVSDHPLMDRPLPTPPDPPEAEKAEEFARNLTKRMSVLLNLDDVDFRSPSALASVPEDAGSRSPSASSSGTATPTGSPAPQESSQDTAEEPVASTTSNPETSSPFGTFLTNAREMNVAFVRGTGTIWDKLFGKDKGEEKEKESDQAKEETQTAVEPDAVANPRQEDNRKDPTHESEERDMEGSRDIMLYSPLIPDVDSVVSVAASEVVTLYGDGADEARERAYRAELRRRWADGRGFISFDALSTIEPVQEETSEVVNNQAREQEQRGAAAPTPDVPKPSGRERVAEESAKPKPKEKVIWVPSPTQISVQVLWWGYRIYLPPPVLHILNCRTIETAKRAALLTGALTWLLENLPLASLPPVLAPAALLLKALVPLLGMIGSFVAWSWKATVTFDRGNGVVLSATWILPIVLVPGTWEDGEVPPPAPMPPPPPTMSGVATASGVESSESGTSRS